MTHPTKSRLLVRASDAGELEPMLDDAPAPRASEQPAPAPGTVAVAARTPDGRLRVERELAAPGSAEAALWTVAARYGCDPTYPDTVTAECDALLASPGLDDPALEDLTALPFVTIDNADSRDLDQALHIARDGRGFRLRYALADAAYYVRPGSALFAEALGRGASYYLPAFAVPMLPPALSEGLISLNPDVERRALVFDIRVGRDGQPGGTRVTQARIRSRAKLAYDGVQELYDALDAGASHRLAGQAYTETLELLRELGLVRIQEAEARDVVRYDRVQLDVVPDGPRLEATADRRNACERYNEQISLLTNIEGARLLAEGVQRRAPIEGIFRVHPAPSEHSLAHLQQQIRAVVRARGLDPQRWSWSRGQESLAAYLRRLPRAGDTERIARAVQRQALLINERSVFADEPEAHFGVGAEVYARLSSPMREIVGVFTHKELLELLGRLPNGDRGRDQSLRQKVIEAGNRAKQRQGRLTKAAHKLVVDDVFEADLARSAPERVGTVVGVKDDRLYVVLDAPPLEVKIYRRDLEGRWRRSGDGTALEGPDGRAVRLGDAVTVRVRGYDAGRQRWRLAV